MSDVDFNMKGINALIALLDAPMPMARLGVLGNGKARADGNTNAQILMKHEFGEDGMPVRSVLRMPVTMKMQDELTNSGYFNKKLMESVIKDKSWENLIKRIGIAGEAVVADAFDTGGFGLWKPSNMAFKANHQTLVETQQLRNSITSDIVEGKP